MGKPSKKWTTRKREWPNGREYWVVGIGAAYGPTVAGKGGGESKYYDKAQAQDVADEMNGKPPKNDISVIDDEPTTTQEGE